MSQRTPAPKPRKQVRAPSQNQAEAARRRLEAAALEAFARVGFHGTTTRDIAAAAGMSPAGLYVHYPSKEEMLYTLSLAGHQRILQLTLDSLATGDEPVAQLRTFMRAFVLQHLRKTTEARVLNYELGALSREHLNEILQLRRHLQREVQQLIERGLTAGVFRTPDARMSAVALLSLGIDLSRWYRPDGEWSAERVADHYSELALRVVGADLPAGGPNRSGCAG
jgi:AcrR family transcriptional regulator